MFGPEFLVAFDLDLRHDFKAGLKVPGLPFMGMQISDPRLRHRNETQPFGFFAEVLGNQSVDNVVLDLLFEALTNDRCRNMPSAKSRDTRQLLIFLDQRLGLTGDVLGRNLNFKVAFGAGSSFGWTHELPFLIECKEG